MVKKILKNNYILVLTDQAISSGSNFILNILYARILGPTEFGKYGLILFIGYLINMIGQNTIATTMAVNIHKYSLNRFNYLIYIFTKYMIIIFVLLLSLIIAKRINYLNGHFFIIYFFLVLFFLFDISKKYLFSTFKYKIILIIDIILFSLIFSQLYLSHKNLTYIQIFIININSFLVTILIIFFNIKLKNYNFCLKKIIIFYKGEWYQIKHLFLSALLQWLNSRVGFYLLAYFHSFKLVGIFNGYMSIVGIFNPLFISLDNYILPKASEEYNKNGIKEAKKLINKVLNILVIPILITSFLLVFFKNKIILNVLGSEYLDYSSVFILIVLTYLMNFLTKRYIYLINILKKQNIFSEYYIKIFIIFTLIGDYFIINFFKIFGLGYILLIISFFQFIYFKRKIENE